LNRKLFLQWISESEEESFPYLEKKDKRKLKIS
jgi:hypothetical protein